MGEALREAMRVVQETAGELSEPIADCVPAMSAPSLTSKTVWCNNTPAISKSELVSLPWGFWSDTTSRVMSVGHWTRHTTGDRGDFAPNHTPPAPNALASQ
jgi:hypothetical protein